MANEWGGTLAKNRADLALFDYFSTNISNLFLNVNSSEN